MSNVTKNSSFVGNSRSPIAITNGIQGSRLAPALWGGGRGLGVGRLGEPGGLRLRRLLVSGTGYRGARGDHGGGSSLTSVPQNAPHRRHGLTALVTDPRELPCAPAALLTRGGRGSELRLPHTALVTFKISPTQVGARSGAGGLPGVSGGAGAREPAHRLRLLSQADFLRENRRGRPRRRLSLPRPHAPPSGDLRSGINAAI